MVAIESVWGSLVTAVQEPVRPSKMLGTEDSSIVAVLVPVEHKRGLVARTPGLEPHIHTDTGHSNTAADNNTDSGGNSREEDMLGQLQSRWGFQFRCGFLLPLGLKNMQEPRRKEPHTGTKLFSPA